MTVFDIKDLHDAIYHNSSKGGKAHEAMALVRHEVVRCLNNGIKTELVIAYGDIMLSVVARNVDAISIRDESLLKLTITALHDATMRERNGGTTGEATCPKKLNIA